MNSAPKSRPESVVVLEQLNRLLASPSFRSSKRCSAFLSHVVEGACQGRSDLLKERTLGVAVFDRRPDYDTNQDPVVRNTAGEVRKRLAQYYCEPGRETEIRIDLPSGAYVPEIYTPPPLPARASERRWVPFALLALLGMLIGAGVGAFLLTRPHPGDLDLFWSPLLKYPGTVVLCVGQGHTYKLKGDLDRVFESASGPPARGFVPFDDIVPAWDRYLSLNDSQTMLRLAVLFTRFGKEISLRGGRGTTLTDLRGKPSVLIGAFNNSWTLSLTGELRFYFEEDPLGKVEIVRDRLNPANRSWEVPTDASEAQTPMDYAIVTRVFNATTERPVVVAAGIKGSGTYAAGEFLTRPAYLAEALRKAPRDWASKNVQFVLATKLFAGVPGPPRVIAAHFW